MAGTELLALVGTATGTLGLGLSTIVFLRDRPRLVIHVVETGAFTENGLVPFLRIYVANAGRQPIALLDVGIDRRPHPPVWKRLLMALGATLYTLVRFSWLARKMTRAFYPRWTNSALADGAEPVVMQPGELRKFIIVRGDPTRYAAIPCYAFAEDFLRRVRRAKYPISTEAASFTYVGAAAEPAESPTPHDSG